jgi:hypothetical protein
MYVKDKENYGFIHFVKYFWANLVIGWEITTEFKPNFYSAIFIEIFYGFVFLSYGFIFISNFNEVLNWGFKDYLLFYFFDGLIIFISGLFWWNKQLKWRITRGEFNNYLYLPGNRFFNYILSFSLSGIIFIIIESLIFIPFIIYFYSISFLNILLVILILFFLIILLTTSFLFFDSFSWRFLELGKILSDNILIKGRPILRQFPATIFQDFRFKYLLMFFYSYFVATIIVPIFQNKQVPDLLFQISIILFLITIFSIGIWINWEYGLKKYEAYG